MKRLYIVNFIIILSLLTSYLYSETSTEIEIKNVVKKFFTCLKQNNQKEIKKIIHEKIKWKNMSKKEIILLGEQMFNDEISIAEYMMNITRHNVYQFLKSNYKLINYKLKGKIMVQEIKGKDNINIKKIYYAKILISYKINKKIVKTRCEIDIIKNKETGCYKILGFIIQY